MPPLGVLLADGGFAGVSAAFVVVSLGAVFCGVDAADGFFALPVLGRLGI